MTLKIAYFAPTVVVAGPVSPVEFSKIFNLAEMLHSHPELNDAYNVGLSIRGGQQIQVYPNTLDIDVQWLVSWLEEACQGYMDLITTQSGVDDLKYCQPKVTSIWTIRQTAGDYQEMHTHPSGNLSGNIYISAPDYNENRLPSDGQILFRLPTNKDLTKFIMNDTWKYTPEPGTFILFPSYLPHTVYPWSGSGHRTIMAFDSVLVPRENMEDGQS
jgi:hypothetical protein